MFEIMRVTTGLIFLQSSINFSFETNKLPILINTSANARTLYYYIVS